MFTYMLTYSISWDLGPFPIPSPGISIPSLFHHLGSRSLPYSISWDLDPSPIPSSGISVPSLFHLLGSRSLPPHPPHLLGSRSPPEPLWRQSGVTNQRQVHLNTDNHPAQCERSQSDSLRAKRNAKGFALASQVQNPTLTITQTHI